MRRTSCRKYTSALAAFSLESLNGFSAGWSYVRRPTTHTPNLKMYSLNRRERWIAVNLRMGDMMYIDVVSVFNGYKTCYYQTFVTGKPSQKQLDIYRQTYDWLYAAAELLKPGISTADIAAVWPTAQELGLSSEAEAFALQLGHGIGISHWSKPVISRMFSMDYPEEMKEGMVLALETYAGSGNEAARIEEMFAITEDGYRQLSKFPSKELISCPCVGSVLP